MSDNIKADPLGGLVPQEVVTARFRGYGPRRGNLERLLRYWRPIMRKPGGFRRCRLILANHPELYPLSNICAWLHHETTGLWPNEGCHHPGMVNCRKKLKKLVGWTDAQFASSLRGKKPKNVIRDTAGKKSLESDLFFHDFMQEEAEFKSVVTESDVMHAIDVLRDFLDMEKDFCKMLRDKDNWEIVGEDETGKEKSHPYEETKSLEEECCG